MELDQVTVATEGFTARLKEAVENSDDDDFSQDLFQLAYIGYSN